MNTADISRSAPPFQGTAPGPDGAVHPVIVVMGVSGCGKSSVAEAVARASGWTCHEGDRHHAPESIIKMRAGTPLTDSDRIDWLDRLGMLLATGMDAGGQVLACSALRRVYRERLRAACPGLRFVFLQLDFHEALARVQARADHFFSPALVADQFATLEDPHGEPGVLVLDATAPIATQAEHIARWLSA